MRMSITPEALRQALGEALAAAWGDAVGATATFTPGAPAGAEPGWIAASAVSGRGTGQVRVWFGRVSATAALARIKKLDAPSDADIVAALTDLMTRTTATLTARAENAGMTFAPPTLIEGPTPADVAPGQLKAPETPACAIALGTILTPADSSQVTADVRLEAVLDVELPLVVRFGRTILPLRSLADLGPGSVVDMGRSPDDPVELLVGDRLIAKGEVVVVNGNYGVRITELPGSRATALDFESRTA